MLANARQHGRHRIHIKRAGTGHALERDVIDITAGHLGHLRHARIGAGGGEQKDQVHVVRLQAGGKQGAFFRRVIDDQHAIDASGGGVADERAFGLACAVLDVVALDRIGIPHQYDGRGAVGCAEGAHHVKHLHQANAKAKRFFAGFLDHRAVSAGVRKRHAQLNHVSAAGDHGVHEFGRDIGKRKACGDVGNQGLAALAFKPRESGCNTAHDWLPAPFAPLASNASGDVATPPLTDRPRIEGRS